MTIKKITVSALIAGVALAMGSCEKTKSYSELLTEEEHAVNWYLAQQTVEIGIPADNKFETGKDAPYYKMDKDGNVYMQVINPGDASNKPEEGDRVYFRFMRQNLKSLSEGADAQWVGNSENFGDDSPATSLIFGNDVLNSTLSYGEGIQVPLEYLGYNCEVNLVVKSPQGFTDGASQCIPYLYNIRYFKAEY